MFEKAVWLNGKNPSEDVQKLFFFAAVAAAAYKQEWL